MYTACDKKEERDKKEDTRQMVKKKEKLNFINLTIFTLIVNQTSEDFVKIYKYFCLPSTNCQQPQLNLVCCIVKVVYK